MLNKIISAIRDSDSCLVGYYLSQEPSLAFEQNHQYETILHLAARCADQLTVQKLVHCGARADTADEAGWTPLHEACNSNNEAAVEIFISTGVNLDLTTRKLETALHIATRRNHTGIMARLLAAGASSHLTNESGNTPLHLAAQKGLIKAVEVLLTAGADTTAVNNDYYSPLHLAASRGQFHCAELMINQGVDPYQKDGCDQNFLEIANSHCRFFFSTRIINSFPWLKDGQPRPEKAEDTTVESNKAARPVLEDFFGNTTVTISKSASDMVLNGMLFGSTSISHRAVVLKTIEAVLWFIAFPALLYLLWQAFSTEVLPPLVPLHLNLENQQMLDFIQNLLSWLIVVSLTFKMVSTDQETSSWLHFVKHLRESIHFRVIHLFLIEILFVPKHIFQISMLNGFSAFWVGFTLIYAVSYMFWWTATHKMEYVATSEFITEN